VVANLSAGSSRLWASIARLVLTAGRAGAGRAIGPLSFWLLWERITDLYYRPQSVRPGSLIRYVITKYRGPVVELTDGTIVSPGDAIAELHFDNANIAAQLSAPNVPGRETAWAWRIVKWAISDLTVLAQERKLPAEVKALHGVTIIARGCRRAGFEVRELPRTRGNDLVRFFMLGLMTIYNPDGKRHLSIVDPNVYPAEIWLGRRALESRFSKRASLC